MSVDLSKSYRGVAESDHSACGVGAIVSLTGKPSHELLKTALAAGSTLSHRMGQAPDIKMHHDGQLIGTSDGFGIIVQIPQEIFASSYIKRGNPDTLQGRHLGVATVFLPRDSWAVRRDCRRIFREELFKAGYENSPDEFEQCRWRDIPIKSEQLGKIGDESHPLLEHLMIPIKPEQSLDDFDRELYKIHRRVENRVWAAGLSGSGRNHFHIASMSARKLVYKSLSMGHRFASLYSDLQNPKFETSFVGWHGRFSTNTAPAWWRAHFKRMLAHNGEINTIRGNINAMYKLKSIFGSSFGNDAEEIMNNVLNTDGADTDMLDNAAQFLSHAGVSLPLVKSILVPPAMRPGAHMTGDEQTLYRFLKTVSPAWEGPAMLIMTDGKILMGGSDLNVMRPTPWEIFGSKDDPDVPSYLVIGSERGMVHDFPQELSHQRGFLQPGDLIGANIDPDNVINGKQIPVGLLDNTMLKNIALRDAGQRLNYISRTERIADAPSEIDIDFSYLPELSND